MARSVSRRQHQVSYGELSAGEPESRAQRLIDESSRLYHLGSVTQAIALLRESVELARTAPLQVQFAAALKLFERGAHFFSPDEALKELSKIRQLASSIGDAPALAGLHLAVARLEACRGLCTHARRHLEIARRLADQSNLPLLKVSIDLVEAGLELVVGNLLRAKELCESCVMTAEVGGHAIAVIGATTNLGTIALWTGQPTRARAYLERVLDVTERLAHVRAGALDVLAQLALFEDQPKKCREVLDRCYELEARATLPALSWNQLSHRITEVFLLERMACWTDILKASESIDAELTRRQFRALRVPVLCARARSLSNLGEHAAAEVALSFATQVCPEGAIDPLIILEVSRGVCLALRGDRTRSRLHFSRAIAACRSIGHKYHERWIERQDASASPTSSSGPSPRREIDPTSAALLLTDATTILGAGHSIDLLAHRAGTILESAFPDGRVEIQRESGHEYRAECSARWEQAADGTFRIRIRGSDRSVSVQVRGVHSLDEVSVVKSVADLVRAAVHRTTEGETDEDEQNLWPRSLVPDSDDAVFQSPRMIELLKIAVRLASTDLPILIDGETGTGKEVFARLIHEHSQVKRGPFVAYNCSAMPRDLVESQLFGHRRGAFTGATDSFPGLIRAAEHGTLFLDEIGDLDPAIQPKLLRFLEGAEIHPLGEMKAQRVPVRIVAATNANLDGLVDEGRFRRDLFYRLGVARLALPPLRERKDEIPALASLFLTRYSRECRRAGVRLADDLIAALLMYDWPGNLRQLANEIRRIVAMADDGQTLHSTDLAPDITAAWNSRPTRSPAEVSARSVTIGLDQPLDRAVEELEQLFVARAMEATGGRVAEAAQLLGISRKGLFLKRRRWASVSG